MYHSCLRVGLPDWSSHLPITLRCSVRFDKSLEFVLAVNSIFVGKKGLKIRNPDRSDSPTRIHWLPSGEVKMYEVAEIAEDGGRIDLGLGQVMLQRGSGGASRSFQSSVN